MRPERPVAVITGAARGIGAAIVRRIVERGGAVIAADLDAEALQRLGEELGERMLAQRADAADEAQVSALFERAQQEFGRVDAVFANAGAVGARGPLQELRVEDFRAATDLLLTSVFLAFKHGIRTMRPHGSGALVATASVASIHGGLGPHAYTAAKHGVKGLVESAAVEIAPYGLTANAVAPGGTVSSLSAKLLGDRDDIRAAYDRLAANSSSGVPTTADDIAAAALFLAFDAPRINGATLIVDGGDDVLPSRGRAHYAAPAPVSTEGYSQHADR